MLTQQQVDYFNTNGFLIIPDFADPKQLLEKAQELAANAQDSNCVFTTSQDPMGDDYFLSSGDKISYFYEEASGGNSHSKENSLSKTINKIGHGLHLREEIFKDFSTGKEIQEIATSLGFNDPRILQSMLIFKNARVGGEVPPHQDSTFIYTNPNSTIGFWFTLQDATRENGCMEFFPGSHSYQISKRMVRSSAKKGTEFVYLDKEPEIKDDDFIKYPTKAGTLVLIHGNVYHRTAKNNSDKSRWVYAWHMIEGEYEYPSSNWLQTELTRAK